MKISPKLSGFLLAIAAVFFSFASAQAKTPVFHFEVGSNDQLSIHPADNPNGPAIAQLVPGDIGKRVSAAPYVYLVSYGHDADGHLSIIVTPEPSNPTDLSFEIRGHTVDMDRNSAVTVTVTNNGNVVIDPGVVGVVHVDGRTTNTPNNLAGNGNGNTPNNGNNTPSPNNTPGVNNTGGQNGGNPSELPTSLQDPSNPVPNPNGAPTFGGGIANNTPDVRTNPQALTPID